MGEEDGDEERFSSVVDTGKWRNIKVCNRLGKNSKKKRDGEGGRRGEEKWMITKVIEEMVRGQ